MAITVVISTGNGIDLRFNTMYNQWANSPTQAGGSSTSYTAVDTGAFDGSDLPIKFNVSGTGLTYSGSFPNIQLTGGTLNSVTELDDSNNTLVTFTGFSVSATTFQSAMNSYVAGGPGTPNPTALNAIFRPLQYNITGGNGADTIQGGNSDDTANLGNGNDFAVSSPGNDTVDGGAGFDTASYFNVGATGAIVAVFSTTATVTGDASVGTDTLVSVEKVRGTQFNDTFTLTSLYTGSFGNFASFEGAGGNDTINGTGTNGTTRAAYEVASAGVFVDLAAGTAQSIAGGDAANVGVDTLIGVTGVSGSGFADTLTAAGAHGQFQFFGNAGNDTITGTALGVSAFDFNTARYDHTNLSSGITVTMGSTATVSGQAGIIDFDTLINVESVRGTFLVDSYTATAAFTAQFGQFNEFEGLGGNDSITGNGLTRVSYANALASVTVNIGTGQGTSTAGGDAAGVGLDTFSGVNSISGGGFGDFLTGSAGAQAERFRGLAGNDTINGNGGSLLDNADYRSAPAGIVANLSLNTVSNDGFGTTDSLSNIFGIRGTNFVDSITGDGNANQLTGGLGDDVINGNGGNDVLVGDDNFDPWAGAFGTGVSSGVPGNDTLDGGTGADQMLGGLGNDIYVVDDGGDSVTENASAGTDTVQTTLATYALGANVENLTFTDGATHTGFGNALANVMTGGTGGDTLVAHTVATIFAAEQDTLSGGNGDDTLYGEGADILNGGIGFDILQVINDFAVNLNLVTAGIEYVVSGFGNDTYTAAAGSTAVEVYGGGGIDSITGGSGNDRLWAGVGNDTLVGNGGNDLLVGDLGADSLSGGAGNDSLYIDDTDTSIDGGADADFAYIATGSGITINLATSNIEWIADFAGGNDTINGSGMSVALNVFAEGGTDNVTGGSGNDIVWGGSGNDTLTGNGGGDTLVGGTGSDTLRGDAGTDALYASNGGGGDGVLDTLVFTDGWGTDFVFDFEHNVDKLDLSLVAGVNFFSDLTLTNTPQGHCYVTFGGNTIAIAGMAGQITQSDFIL